MAFNDKTRKPPSNSSSFKQEEFSKLSGVDEQTALDFDDEAALDSATEAETEIEETWEDQESWRSDQASAPPPTLTPVELPVEDRKLLWELRKTYPFASSANLLEALAELRDRSVQSGQGPSTRRARPADSSAQKVESARGNAWQGPENTLTLRKL